MTGIKIATGLTLGTARGCGDQCNLRWRVVANAGRESTQAKARWSHVRDTTAHGYSVCRQMCESAGFDPDEIVGGAKEQRGEEIER